MHSPLCRGEEYKSSSLDCKQKLHQQKLHHAPTVRNREPAGISNLKS